MNPARPPSLPSVIPSRASTSVRDLGAPPSTVHLSSNAARSYVDSSFLSLAWWSTNLRRSTTGGG